jgi:hypothetical protein
MILQLVDATKEDKSLVIPDKQSIDDITPPSVESKTVEESNNNKSLNSTEKVKNAEDTETVKSQDSYIKGSVTESFLFINFSYGYNKMKLRENTHTKAEAAKLITNFIKDQEGTESEFSIVGGSTIAIIEERFLEDSFEKMGVQAFTVLNTTGRFIGNFLIYNQSVTYVRGSLTEVCIADVDEDGEFELLSMFGWGSGIYRIELLAYKCINPINYSSLTKVIQGVYRNCFVPKDGYGKLTMKKISDTEVHLLDHDWKEEDDGNAPTEPRDYGKITLAEDGLHLVPELIDTFPYDQWDDVYNQNNLSSEAEDLTSENENDVTQPPEITISSGDKTITYEVTKLDWTGEKNDSSSFFELMKKKEEIVYFDNPDNLQEFVDYFLLDFGKSEPASILVRDYLITESGAPIYTSKEIINREVKLEGDGKFSFGLYQHMAMMLSSNMDTYTNPSYRGFRIWCSFGEDKICEYTFVIKVGPMSKIEPSTSFPILPGID